MDSGSAWRLKRPCNFFGQNTLGRRRSPVTARRQETKLEPVKPVHIRAFRSFLFLRENNAYLIERVGSCSFCGDSAIVSCHALSWDQVSMTYTSTNQGPNHVFYP